ncbi:nodulin homeobox-like isoform X2 [Salvia splendens]|uniref:nodulin homeobox-like isoform X2 n=1 Tax=Salvia splendens TaxID=180675 RepID=UPI001C26E55E|nr:nodulin homeobox-like isoform X2 [Salvia splendens]
MSNVVNTCFCSRELELEFLFCIHVSAPGTSFISVQLLHLCEAESVSYLEEVASKTSTQDVAKSVGLKVLALLKKMFNAPSEASYPKGQLELNAMRLADVLSDDSNFLSFIMINFMRRICQQVRSVHMEGLSETVRWILLSTLKLTKFIIKS